MTFRTTVITIIAGALLSMALGCGGGEPEIAEFEAAKERAAERRQPVLIEFTTETQCEDCRAASYAIENDPEVSGTLSHVSFVSFNVEDEAGKKLAERFRAGDRLPVYVMTSSEGKEITRWTGFLAPQRFMRQYGAAQQDLTTIEDRMRRMEENPTLTDAFKLGEHFMKLNQYVKAAEYFREADRLAAAQRKDYKFEVFFALANAAWRGDIEFDGVESAALEAMTQSRRASMNAVRVTEQLGNVARKTGDTDKLAPYLRVALERAPQGNDPTSTRIRGDLTADLLLYGDHDTAAAIEAKRASAGPSFSRQPTDDFAFAEWCIERGINVDEARSIIERLIETGSLSGQLRGRDYFMLAKAAVLSDDHQSAVSYAEQAVATDPANPVFQDFLDDLR